MNNGQKPKKKLPVGTSDFRKLRENNYHYIDKSRFVRDVIDDPSEVLLIPRPRRFGKTLNLSMLRYFFEKSGEDQSALFDGLAVRNDEVFEAHQGRYPVIYMTFKDVKHRRWPECLAMMQLVIYKEYARHRYLLDSDVLFPEEKRYVQRILDGKSRQTDDEWSIGNLSAYLRRYHDERTVILIDEYDTPLHSGYANGYYKEAVAFIRNFLSGGLKDNENLFKGVLTGILRVAKESVFSGLNNPGVYTLLDEEFKSAFGFTDDEVRSLLADYGLSDGYDEVSHWYNGYLFGDEVIYNPWSVMNYAAKKRRKARPWWVNTGDTEIIERLATREGSELREELGQLLEGGAITKPVYDSIIMRDLKTRDDLLWSFLLFSGYLKVTGPEIRRNFYDLRIPNEEVRVAYEEMIERWFAEKVRSNQLEEMLGALENGDVILFERMLRVIVMRIMSYHDLAGEPEKVYHALVLGMLVRLSGKYEIRSNRESGYGRYDLMMKPEDPDGQGIIIEFKRLDDDEKKGKRKGKGKKKKKGKKKRKMKTPEDALREALEQIEKRGYAAELEAAGIRKILKLAVVFRGKELWVKRGNEGK
ncbi:AAA family ATPase [Desulfobacterales bacterium HSG2]|nr:AAA family ATPase [Desulfobacterales bacterium HSG2]